MGDFQHETLDIPFSTDTSTDIDQITLQELIEDQPWCLSVNKATTKNKVIITTTMPSLPKARDWLDTQLPLIYAQHIDNKIDVTTLAHITPRRLDKPILTVASTAYAAALKSRTQNTPICTDNAKKFAQPPRMTKPHLANITFDEKEFPALTTKNDKSNKQQSSVTTETTTDNNSNSSTATTTPTPAYDYKKELERISNDIEMTLKKQFDDVFAQLEKKLDHFMQQYAEQHDEQEKFNTVVTQKLGYLVDNMKRFVTLAHLPADQNSPSPMEGDGPL